MANKIKGVRQRGSGWMVDLTFEGQRHTETFKNEADAVKWRSDFLEAKKNGADV